MTEAPDPAIAAHPSMLLTVEAAMAGIWRKLGERADKAPDPTRIGHLASRKAALHPIHLRHCAALVSRALAGNPRHEQAD